MRRLKSSTAKMAVNIGTAPFSSPATAELMCCSAIGNSVNGMATQMTDSAAMRKRSSRSSRMRAPGSSASVAAPRLTRAEVMTPGSKLSRPMAMKRNDAPQMRLIAEKIAQSSPVNAAPVVAAAGVGAGRAVVTPHL